MHARFGGVVICTDKEKLDLPSAKKKLGRSQKRNYFYAGREWPYKNVPPRIIAEQYMADESGKELKDYKIFCFNGKPKLIEVDFGRFDVHKRNLYTTKWKYINASIQYPNDPDVQISRPVKLEEMLHVAAKLSEGIPHVRVDMYSIDEKIYFGEMTMFHDGGTGKFTPEVLGRRMGKWIELYGRS